MRTAQQLLTLCNASGVRLWQENGSLCYEGAASIVDPLLPEIASLKPSLLELLATPTVTPSTEAQEAAYVVLESRRPGGGLRYSQALSWAWVMANELTGQSLQSPALVAWALEVAAVVYGPAEAPEQGSIIPESNGGQTTLFEIPTKARKGARAARNADVYSDVPLAA